MGPQEFWLTLIIALLSGLILGVAGGRLWLTAELTAILAWGLRHQLVELRVRKRVSDPWREITAEIVEARYGVLPKETVL